MFGGIEVERAEKLRAIFGDGVLFGDDADVAEAQGLDKGIYDFMVRDGPVGCRGRRRRDQSEFFGRGRAASSALM